MSNINKELPLAPPTLEELKERQAITRAAIGHLAQAHSELLEAGDTVSAGEILDEMISVLGRVDLNPTVPEALPETDN